MTTEGGQEKDTGDGWTKFQTDRKGRKMEKTMTDGGQKARLGWQTEKGKRADKISNRWKNRQTDDGGQKVRLG